jgi:hypothetical protein
MIFLSACQTEKAFDIFERMSAYCGMSQKPLTPSQLRVARQYLDWNQVKLAEESLVSVATVRRFEAGPPDGALSPLHDRSVRAVLEKAGIVFIDQGEAVGVRFVEGVAKLAKGRRK